MRKAAVRTSSPASRAGVHSGPVAFVGIDTKSCERDGQGRVGSTEGLEAENCVRDSGAMGGSYCRPALKGDQCQQHGGHRAGIVGVSCDQSLSGFRGQMVSILPCPKVVVA